MATRRGFLTSLIAASAAPALGWAAAGNPRYLAAARRPDGSFALYGLGEDGGIRFAVPLPARGHAGAGHPQRAEAVAFARRPGAFALVLDCLSGDLLHRLTPPEARQFNGHGTFDPTGRLLFTSEQLNQGSEGRIGVWDVDAGYVRIGEYRTGGIGPHDLRLMPDGKTLVVANGGIETDPEDRSKLNLGTMAPSLAYLSTDGALLEMVSLGPDSAQNSIRHLAVRPDGLVCFAMQWEGEPGEPVPLLGLHRRGAGPVLAQAPLEETLAMQGYAGSIALSGDGTEVAITSPRGGRLQRFGPDGALLGAVARADICGLAPLGAGFLASDGFGGLIAVEGVRARPLGRADAAWDNHVVALG